MPRNIRKQDNSVNENLSGWDNAIADAKRGIARLQAALSHAEEMKKVGEPWPGTQSANQNSESCHSV
jgi:hypothetical protein